MIESRLFCPGDEITTFLIAVAVAAAAISTISLIVSFLLGRQPAVRHTVLFVGLICIGMIPFLVATVALGDLSLCEVVLQFPAKHRSSPVPASKSELLTTTVNPTNAEAETRTVGPQPLRLPANQIIIQNQSREKCQDDSFPTTDIAASFIGRPAWFNTSVCLFWAMGSLLLAGRFVKASLRSAAICRAAQPLSNEAYPLARAEAMVVMNQIALPKIVVSRDVQTPAVARPFQPQIVLPQSLVESLSEAEIHDILVHETAHAVRRDLWVVQLEALVLIMFWPIPMISSLVRELSRVREELCDIYVLQNRQRRDYGNTLLRIARITKNGSTLPLTTGILYGPAQLQSRVAKLLDGDRDESTRTSWLLFIGILIAFLLATGTICSIRLMANIAPEGRDQAAVLPKSG